MLLVHVLIHVKPEQIEAFKAASVENARHSILEEGIVRFDLIQELDDPTRFMLVEAYRDPGDANAHKETAHYAKWRAAVAEMMAEPRSNIKYREISP